MTDEQPDYYEILGVERSATTEEITRSYRRAMHAVHPDAKGTSGLFRLVKTAYEVLKDPKSRAAYDARHRTVPPEPPRPRPPRPRPEPEQRPRPEPEPEPEPQPQPRPESREKKKDENAGPRPRSSPPRSDTVTTKQPPGKAGSAPRVRPRFGSHRIRVVAIVVWAVLCLAAVYLLWPAGLPVGFMLLLLVPLIALPVIAREPALRGVVWPWTVCMVPFVGTAALAATEADGGAFWALCGALAALTVAAMGLAAAPSIVTEGRELDRLMGPEWLDYEIFNVPGAGLGDGAAREVAQASAAGLQMLAALDGVRIVHALIPPQPQGKAVCYIDHVVLRGNRLAVIIARRWPAATYDWTPKGALTADGRSFPGGDTGIAAAVKGVRKVVPRGVRVRGFVAVIADGTGQASGPDFAPPRKGDLLAGDLVQVREQVGAWLEETDPVVRRRVFAALLPHVRHP